MKTQPKAFSYIALVLAGTLLGWNIAQFWSYANYTLDFAVNEIGLCLCGVFVYLFIRVTSMKKVNNMSSDFGNP